MGKTGLTRLIGLIGLMGLIVSCTQDAETEVPSVLPGAVPITFCCTAGETTLPTQCRESYSFTRAGEQGEFSWNNNLLLYTGFGLFAGHLNDGLTAGESLDMMYNQKVEYSFLADKEGDIEDPYGNGYWSYSPIKYWPNDPLDITKLFFCAYAPYVETADGTGTGITGISANSEANPYITYTWSDKYNETVDLLWSYDVPSVIPPAKENKAQGTLSMTMHHALARLQIKIKAETLPANTKVLIEKITLQGKMAQEGNLKLNNQTTETVTIDGKEVTRYYPVWTDLSYDDSRLIVIDTDNESYCSINDTVQYVKDNGEALPYEWQPEGVTTELHNAIYDFKTSRLAFVYLIPQDEPLELTVKVKYHKMTATTDEVGIKTTTTTPWEVADPMKGNTTYTLELNLQDI